MAKERESKIPHFTSELAQRVEANADALAAIGFKEWKKRRKMKGLTKEATMTELEQDEQLRRIEEGKDG